MGLGKKGEAATPQCTVPIDPILVGKWSLVCFAFILNAFLLLFRSNCKNFLDTYSPSDKGRGKSCLPVGPPLSRIQNAAKRSPATYGHSQKKHKCSFYYSKQKPSTSVASSANITTEEKQTLTLASSLSAAKEDACADIISENWVSLKYASGVNVNLQKNLTLPKNVLNKEENSLKNTVVNNTSSECSMKEGIQTCMFPKETDIKTSENVAELKEQEPCLQKTSKKPPESPLPKSPPQSQQADMPEVSRKHGNLGRLFDCCPLVSCLFPVRFGLACSLQRGTVSPSPSPSDSYTGVQSSLIWLFPQPPKSGNYRGKLLCPAGIFGFDCGSWVLLCTQF